MTFLVHYNLTGTIFVNAKTDSDAWEMVERSPSEFMLKRLEIDPEVGNISVSKVVEYDNSEEEAEDAHEMHLESLINLGPEEEIEHDEDGNWPDSLFNGHTYCGD